MATTLYLRADVPDLWGTGTATSGWNAKDASRAITPGDSTISTFNVISLSATVGTGSGSTPTAATVTGATAGRLFSSETLPLGAFSAPLDADVTISSTVNFDICASESSMNANATVVIAVYRVDAQGALTLIVKSSLGTELGTGNARQSWSATPTSTAMKKGDRILVVPMIDDATSVTMASGFTVTMTYNGATASTADSKVTFTENLGFLTSAPAGTTYYLRDTASDVSGAKALSTTQGSGTVEATHTTVVGPLTYPGDQWTATAGGSDIEWFTAPLDAFTLGGAVLVVLGGTGEQFSGTLGGASPFDRLTSEIAICDSDGSNPVVWARGYTEQPVNSVFAYLSGADTTVTQGKRLRVRVYQDDYRPNNAVAGTNRVIRYDGTASYASRLQFTQSIIEEGSFTPLDPMGMSGFFGL